MRPRDSLAEEFGLLDHGFRIRSVSLESSGMRDCEFPDLKGLFLRPP